MKNKEMGKRNNFIYTLDKNGKTIIRNRIKANRKTNERKKCESHN